MTFEFYVNGEKRKPNQEECGKLLESMMRPLGYEPADKKEISVKPEGASA
ncbi:MAG: hypothetical protein MRZ11_05950 [Allisonella histaminiformans]|nr:hypothetical protein [Allisonella histaminiformans]MCI6003823.1 hypothetical protein [Allisonella histaminiformans]